MLDQHPIISKQVDRIELNVILRELEKVLDRDVAGGVAEFGCYIGTTSLFLQRLLQESGSGRQLHVYDSFAGLPAKTAADHSPAGEQFKQGELLATKMRLVKEFTSARLPLPVIHKAWFSELTADDIPPAIAFAFLDGDFYQSVKQSLQLVGPRLSQGAVVIVDDYQSEALPGARRAVDEWLQRYPAKLTVEASLAIIAPVPQAI